ncbi:hypothetical protein HPP92_012301 [Vanilla planifolia]|uniref:Pectinesterase inhibitor domain-containing protein n=1 Tax=Vanilla planifolia TaxID=51239 RepID=A0A835UXX6_VANPL|nr:hypothetical protein HPP92_012697 [Vanilla planifolia]KAG0477582.1 hypothetical protein HPP92_012301 [Vanilla planifolia]
MASVSDSWLLILLLPFFSPSFSTDVIESTCNSTSYHDLCVAAVTSTGAARSSDARGISAIVLSLALTNATNSSAYAARMASAPASAPALRSLFHACAEKYAAAGEALRWALKELRVESYDYAFVHASAAAEYPTACRVLFGQRKNASTAVLYPPELVRREEDLRRLCTVAVEIISLLG